MLILPTGATPIRTRAKFSIYNFRLMKFHLFSSSGKAIVQKFRKAWPGKPVSDPANSGRGRKPGREFVESDQASAARFLCAVKMLNVECNLSANSLPIEHELPQAAQLGFHIIHGKEPPRGSWLSTLYQNNESGERNLKKQKKVPQPTGFNPMITNMRRLVIPF